MVRETLTQSCKALTMLLDPFIQLYEVLQDRDPFEYPDPLSIFYVIGVLIQVTAITYAAYKAAVTLRSIYQFIRRHAFPETKRARPRTSKVTPPRRNQEEAHSLTPQPALPSDTDTAAARLPLPNPSRATGVKIRATLRTPMAVILLPMDGHLLVKDDR
jgi:hypothetical protein